MLIGYSKDKELKAAYNVPTKKVAKEDPESFYYKLSNSRDSKEARILYYNLPTNYKDLED